MVAATAGVPGGGCAVSDLLVSAPLNDAEIEMRGVAPGLICAGVLLSAPAALAAGFDCAKAKAPIELAICGNPDLNALDDEMTAAFRAARASAENPDAVLADQRKWNQSRAKECGIDKAEDAAHLGKLDCAKAATRRRIDQLKSWNELGRVTILTADPNLGGLCSQILPTLSRGTVALPAGATRPAWTKLGEGLARGQFDFENSGKPRTVFLVDIETSHYEYHWYILPEPAEEEAVAGRLRTAVATPGRTEELLERLAGDLDHTVVSPLVMSTANPALNKQDGPRALKSRLIDTSNTPLYRGWYTRPLAVQFLGKTVIAAESVNNLNGPTTTLFKPGPGGALEPLCYFRALPRP